MPNAREQYLQVLSSLTEVTRSRAERLAGLLAKQGELQTAQAGRFAEQLVLRTRKNRETVSRLIQREVKRQMGALGIATRDEVARLQQRVRALEQAVERPARATARTLAAAAEPAGRAPAARGGGRRSAGTSTTGTTGTTRSGTSGRRSTAGGGSARAASGSGSGTRGAGTRASARGGTGASTRRGTTRRSAGASSPDSQQGGGQGE